MTDPTARRPVEAGVEEVDGRLVLSAPAAPAIVDLVHALIDQLWSGHPDVSAPDRTRFELGVIEILANIVEHAYRLDHESSPGRRRFDVCLGATEDALVATFADNGLPMELDLSNVVLPEELAESGRGLAMAAAALDDLDYERVEGRNHWRLRCIRRPD